MVTPRVKLDGNWSKPAVARALTSPPLTRCALLALAYLAGGALSMGGGFVAHGASGQTPLVWLPPGIALAGLLIWGQRCWRGVGASALLMATLLSYHDLPSAPFRTHATLGLLIGSAMTLQAVVTSTLVRRFVDPTLTLDRSRSVLGFLLCTASASLITCSIGSLLLIRAGGRSVQDLAFDWPSWWASDTISAFLVTPVLLAWVAKPAPVWRPRRLQLTLPLGISLLLVATAYTNANRLENERAHANFNLEVDHLAAELAHQLASASASAQAVNDLLSVSSQPSATPFRAFAATLRRRNPTINGVAWVPVVRASERAQYEAEQRLDGQPDYEIRELAGDGRLGRAGERAEYLPVQFVEPGAIGISGMDENTLGSRRRLLEQAGRTRALTLSAPLQLFGSGGGDPLGVLVVSPVYASDQSGQSQGALRGFVVLGVLTTPLLKTLLIGQDLLDVRVADPLAAPTRQLLFASSDVHLPEARLPYLSQREIRSGGRTWTLNVRPTAAYLHEHRSWLAPAVCALGFVFAALLCGFLLVTTGRSANIAQLVTERTAALSRANEQLREGLTAREQAGQALLESEARLQFALEEAGQGFWDLDLSLNRLYWSPRMLEALGYAESDLDPTMDRWLQAVHPEDLPAAMAAFQRHLSGESPFYKAEFRIRRKDGAYAWRLTQAKVLTRDDQGKPVRVVGTQIDISERKRSERDLEDLVQARTSELEVAKIAAEAANRAKSLFLANMSHELRTPMHAVLAYARLGLERTPDAKVQSFMTRIVENADRLLLLLNDLLDLSKLEAGKMQLRLESYDVEQLVREVASELEPLMTSKGLVLAYEREGTCQSSSALVDRSRMAQLFRNILANAVRFSAPGGRIVVRFACADARSLPEHAGATAESALEVAISDQGVGIPEGELEHIFDSFVQSSTTHASAGGTGLGLAICRQIAGLHQGTVHARKQTGVGATFVVTLPSERRVESHAREVA